ncbi:MAG: 2'-5' RNA ligase family protein [Dehalococcoidia bacterium]|nr:2'-5' RNA ligase family protein [Dehalococcoidia bacterium]
MGLFGGREGLRVMWVGIAGDVLRLEALVRDVNLALSVVGFEPERRPFRPHLTLGRVRDEISTRRRAEIEVATGKIDVPPVPWRTEPDLADAQPADTAGRAVRRGRNVPAADGAPVA